MSWIFKTEPSECSIDDIANAGPEGVVWEGVRNYQARNFLRDEVKLNDLVLIHHSSCAEVGLVGVGKVVKLAYADPSQFDNASPYYFAKATPSNWPWVAVNVAFVEKFSRVLTMNELRQHEQLADMVLLRKGNRLSVMPLTKIELELVLFLNNA
jgi:predicted RNA-binding protein with PUA-like domain